MAVTGEKELLANIRALKLSTQAKQQEALLEAGDVVKNKLIVYTPVGTIKSASRVKLINFADKGRVKYVKGNAEINVGFRKGGASKHDSAAWRAHFPDSGTRYQSAQRFSEKARISSKDEVLSTFVDKMRLGR